MPNIPRVFLLGVHLNNMPSVRLQKRIDKADLCVLYSWQYDMRHFYAASLAFTPVVFACSLFLVFGINPNWDTPDGHSTDFLPVLHNPRASSEANDCR